MKRQRYGRTLERLVRQAVRWLPISSCYECRHRNEDQCRCLLTDRKRNRHPAEGIPAWCPLPNAPLERSAVADTLGGVVGNSGGEQ